MDLLLLYPDAGPELNFTTDYELLVAVILLLNVRMCASISLPRSFLPLPTHLRRCVNSVKGGRRSFIAAECIARRPKHFITAQILLDEYDGIVPDTREELMRLPGVGRKTANVVLSNAFGMPAIAVDTHVSRLAFRLGLSDEKDPFKIELDLQKVFPMSSWTKMHHLLILHGRRVCTARSPKCQDCSLKSYCPRKGLAHVSDKKSL